MSENIIQSPLPGTFYRKPAPDQSPYKEVGDTVAIGETIGLVEVMKSFHEIQADKAGTITSFHVDNEDAIIAGQTIVELKP